MISRNNQTAEPKDLDCFLNQPNINMTIPWIYQMYKKIVGDNMQQTSRSVEHVGQQDEPKDLDCFLNQPNINMTIPWIYKIYKKVQEGGTGGPTWNDEQNKDSV